MGRAVYEAQIADLEDAMVRCPKHRRALVLQQVTKLFLDDRRETVHKLAYLDEVLVCLMRPASTIDLANVSNALVRSGLKLPKALQQLALHRDPSVAVPIALRRTVCLLNAARYRPKGSRRRIYRASASSARLTRLVPSLAENA